MKKLIIGIFLAFILLISGIFSSNTYAGCGCDSGGGVCLCSLPVGICESCGGDDDQCPYGNLRGALDVANCTEIKGWVHDGDGSQEKGFKVYLYENGNYFASIVSSYLRQDICDFFSFGDDCSCDNAGWTLTTPNSLKDGNTHTITAWAEGEKFGWTQLANARSFTCVPPVAACSCSTTAADVHDLISFNNSSTNAGGGYTWNFGDGTTTAVAEPTHRYDYSTTFPVRLTAWGSGGTAGLSSSVKCCDIVVHSPYTDVTCSVSGNQITWNWDPITNADIYGFRRADLSYDIQTSQTSITHTLSPGTYTGYIKALSPFSTGYLASATCETAPTILKIFKREIDDPDASCANVIADISPTESSSSPLLASVLGVKTAMSNLLAEEPVERPITDPIVEPSPSPGVIPPPPEEGVEQPIENPNEPIIEEGGTFRAKIEDLTHGLLSGSIFNLDASVEVEPGDYQIRGDYNSNDDLFSKDDYVICDDGGNRSTGSDALTVTVDSGGTTNVYIGFVELKPGNIELIKKEVDGATITCDQLEGGDPPSPGSFSARVDGTDYPIVEPKTTIPNLDRGYYSVNGLEPADDGDKYMDDYFIYCVDGEINDSPQTVEVIAGETTTVYVGFIRRPQVTGNIYLRDDQACLADGEAFSGVTINCTAFSDFRQADINNGGYTCRNPSDDSLYFNPGDQVGVTIADIPAEYKYRCTVGNLVINVPEDGPNFVLTSVQDAWFQTQGGDVYAGEQIQSEIPATCIEPDCLSYLSLDSLDAAVQPGSVSWGGEDDPGLGSGSVSSRDWQAETGSYGGLRADYGFFRKHLGSQFEEVRMDSGDYPGDGFWLTDIAGDILTIGEDGWNIPDNEQVVIVHTGSDGNIGHIEIQGNIEIGANASLLMVASGTITFTGSVTSAEGVYIADQIVVEDDGDTNQQFTGRGSFIGWESISLNRDLEIDNNLKPGELFIYKPEFIYNLPDVVKRPLYDWREVGY